MPIAYSMVINKKKMVNFKLGNMKDGIFNVPRAWDEEKV